MHNELKLWRTVESEQQRIINYGLCQKDSMRLIVRWLVAKWKGGLICLRANKKHIFVGFLYKPIEKCIFIKIITCFTETHYGGLDVC